MSFLSRVTRGRAGKPGRPRIDGENILVISDVHLGEDILVQGPEHLAGHIRALNKELADFIDQHCEALVDGRRWHLVINGDMFDFVKVSLRPEPGEALTRWQRQLTVPEHRWGLENTEQHVVWKLERIMEIHRPLFKRMARFLVHGHRITLVEGNHDAEFYFEQVQQALRAHLVELARRVHDQEGLGRPFSEAEIGNAIGFRGWFEAMAGRYHIEHGHQYDDMCSFEYPLAPYDHAEASTLATPMSHRPMPYMAELLGDFSTHGLDGKGLLQLLPRLWVLGPRALWQLLLVYVVLGGKLVRRAGRKRREQLKALQEQHHGRLRALAHSSSYGLQTLARLDELKADPAEFSTWKMVHAFFMDRIISGLIVVVGLLAALALDDPQAQLRLAAVVLAFGLVCFLLIALWPKRNVVDALRRTAADIADCTGARYVVFGHSHHPEIVDLTATHGVGRYGERCYYLNNGSWVTREVLRGPGGRGMSYVEITGSGASLMRWVGAGRAPLELARAGSLESVDGRPGEASPGPAPGGVR